jgi:hypothetical protein
LDRQARRIAADQNGTTVPHRAAAGSGKDNIALLFALGADKTARDKNAGLPPDRVPQSNQEVRDLLRTWSRRGIYNAVRLRI